MPCGRTIATVSEQTTPETAAPKIESHDPAAPEAYKAFMREGWADLSSLPPRAEIADLAADRRARLAATFPGERLVLPAGGFKVRNYDCDYRFRPDSAHTYLTGNHTSDAVLVVDDGEAVLYARPRAGRENDEFFRDRQYGALWVGARPSLEELSAALGLEVRHIDALPDVLTDGGPGGKTRVHRGVSRTVDRLLSPDESLDADLARVLSEMRLVKDDWEIGQLQEACDVTTLGFEDVVREWDRVLEHGERWIEGTFHRRARVMGNGPGYESIVGGGSHATTLHWTDNSGPVEPGTLLLLDMGVEGDHLYTADVTRTLPVDGTFTPLQRQLYDLVFAAQDAGIAAVRPGEPFSSSHEAAMTVLAHGLADLDLLPVSAEEALDPESKVYARWTLHGTSHMLGLDVHDCGKSAPESYAKGSSPRAWCSPSSPASTSRPTTCSCRRSCAASASASRTTSSSPPTAPATSPPPSPAPPPTSRRGGPG